MCACVGCVVSDTEGEETYESESTAKPSISFVFVLVDVFVFASVVVAAVVLDRVVAGLEDLTIARRVLLVFAVVVVLVVGSASVSLCVCVCCFMNVHCASL